MPLIVRPAAAADIEDAFDWYERQSSGLGVEFLDAVRSALERIASRPAAYQVVHRNTRRALVRRFPYSVIYRLYGDRILVVARMHGRRDPRRWASRA